MRISLPAVMIIWSSNGVTVKNVKAMARRPQSLIIFGRPFDGIFLEKLIDKISK